MTTYYNPQKIQAWGKKTSTTVENVQPRIGNNQSLVAVITRETMMVAPDCSHLFDFQQIMRDHYKNKRYGKRQTIDYYLIPTEKLEDCRDKGFLRK